MCLRGLLDTQVLLPQAAAGRPRLSATGTIIIICTLARELRRRMLLRPVQL
jgi:hypothetical protein